MNTFHALKQEKPERKNAVIALNVVGIILHTVLILAAVVVAVVVVVVVD